jgi:hypothetical protein
MQGEKDLLQKLSLLKNIEPKSNWVLFAKSNILDQAKENIVQKEVGHESLIGQVGHALSYLRYLEKPAFVFAALAFVVLGGVGYQVSQNSLPGDALYSIRSVLERATTGNDALASLGTAQRRLQDLKKVVEGNKVKNLSFATQEFNQSVAEVSKGFIALVENEPKKALRVSKKLVQLQKDKAQIEQVLGASLGGNENSELREATRILVEMELNDLTARTLSKDQKTLLENANGAFKKGEYENALEMIWEISNGAE